MRPRVALTTPLDPQGGEHERPTARIYANYIDALERVGLAALLVTPAHAAGAIDALLDACHGAVLSGGGDIDPAGYGESVLAGLEDVSPERDAVERRVLDGAGARGLPVLGICRGLQLINVHRGGTLWQDIPSQVPGAVDHQQPGPWGRRHHVVTVAPDSRLAGILGTGTASVNSYHHQAVKDLAPGLQAVAWSPDGLVEAFENEEAEPWLVAVQWHLERFPDGATDEDPDIRVLRAFAGAARARAEA